MKAHLYTYHLSCDSILKIVTELSRSTDLVDQHYKTWQHCMFHISDLILQTHLISYDLGQGVRVRLANIFMICWNFAGLTYKQFTIVL
jgi:hypothetical protein